MADKEAKKTVHEDGLTVPPTIVGSLREYLHAQNHRSPCHDLHRVVTEAQRR